MTVLGDHVTEFITSGNVNIHPFTRDLIVDGGYSVQLGSTYARLRKPTWSLVDILFNTTVAVVAVAENYAWYNGWTPNYPVAWLLVSGLYWAFYESDAIIPTKSMNYVWGDPQEAEHRQIADKAFQLIKIASGETIIAYVHQEIVVKDHITYTLTPYMSLCQLGIVATFSTDSVNIADHPAVLLTNVSKQSILLFTGMIIGKVQFRVSALEPLQTDDLISFICELYPDDLVVHHPEKVLIVDPNVSAN